MKNTSELAKKKLELIQKGFPKDPCKHCTFKEVGECGCEDQINYRHDLEHLLDLGIYNLMLDLQEINRKKAEIVWIRHEINKKNQQIVTIQKQINELKESCKVTLTQLQEASDKSNHH